MEIIIYIIELLIYIALFAALGLVTIACSIAGLLVFIFAIGLGVIFVAGFIAWSVSFMSEDAT